MTNRNLMRQRVLGLQEKEFIVAAWEGGSAANNRADEFSDLDLVLVTEDKTVEAAFSELEKLLGAVRHTWQIPEPAWHGHSQRFYMLEESDPYFFVDAVVIKRNSENWFLEKERHGVAQVLFDKFGLVKPTTFDETEWANKMERRRAQIRDSYPFLITLVRKEIKRNRPLDALSFYHRGALSMLVELMGMKYRPHRYDFGMRYLSFDFPNAVYEELVNLSYPRDISHLEHLIDVVERKLKEHF